MILKIQFSAKKSQKNICYTEIHTPVEEFMRFKEELIFTGVNHPSYLFTNIVKKINFFFHKSGSFQQFFHFNTQKGLQIILRSLELQKQILTAVSINLHY